MHEKYKASKGKAEENEDMLEDAKRQLERKEKCLVSKNEEIASLEKNIQEKNEQLVEMESAHCCSKEIDSALVKHGENIRIFFLESIKDLRKDLKEDLKEDLKKDLKEDLKTSLEQVDEELQTVKDRQEQHEKKQREIAEKILMEYGSDQ